MSDELADLDGINESSLARLATPRFNVCHGRPRIKGRVDLHGVEAFSVVPSGPASRKPYDRSELTAIGGTLLVAIILLAILLLKFTLVGAVGGGQ